MKIEMRTLAAGPSGNLLPGQQYDLDEKFAAELVKGGYAKRVSEFETTAGEGAPETSAQRTAETKPKSKRRRPKKQNS